MKLRITAVLLVLASYCFVGCTKTKETLPPKNPIVGLWVGTYQYTENPAAGEFYYSLDLFADSTVVNQGGGINGVVFMSKGSWSLSHDSTLTVNLSSADYSQGSWTQVLTGKYSSATGTISNGQWHFTSGQTSAGTFSLKRSGLY